MELTRPEYKQDRVARHDFNTIVAERNTLYVAIEQHRKRWEAVNGTNPANALPSDLELWATIE